MGCDARKTNKLRNSPVDRAYVTPLFPATSPADGKAETNE
jgi:hypothetical protein